MAADHLSNFDDIATFLADELALDKAQVTTNARLRQDLGVNADNADELMRDFAFAFDVDLRGFRINDYFGAGGTLPYPLAFILWLFGNARPLKTLTVLDLVRAAETGKL